MRLRNSLKAAVRPVYRRLPFLQRLWHAFLYRRHVLAQRIGLLRQSAGNLPAFRALSQRRFDPHCRNRAYPAWPIIWPALDISVVTYNSRKWVEPFLASLAAQAYPPSRIHLCIVDHGSQDGTVDALRQSLAGYRAQLGSVEIIEQDNLGFGAGHHRALKGGTADYALVTNIDLELRPESLANVVAVALADDGRNVASWELRQVPYEHPKYHDPVTLETNWSSHACILLRRSAYDRVGGYDPAIFMYAEDVELSYRFRSFGYVLKYVPHATVVHHTYQTAGEVKPRQITGSTLGNLYLRRRYGGRREQLTGLLLYAALILRGAPFPGARCALLGNLWPLLRNQRHFGRGRGPATAWFPFRAFGYDIRREGAFQESAPPVADGPLVSVITRTYNGRTMFLVQALQSLLNQTWPRLEIIVVQDGGESLRSVVEGMRRYARPGHELVFLATAGGGRSVAGNAGLASARGDYLLFLDDDDLLFADHVETLTMALQADPEAAAAYALAMEVMTDVDTEHEHYDELEPLTPVILRQPWDYRVLQDHNFIPIQGIVFRRTLYLERGGFDTRLEQLEDWNLWLRYGYRNRFIYIPRTTSLYRSPADRDVRAARAALLDEAYDTARNYARASCRDIAANTSHDAIESTH